ncbi:MAG: hypothetical protein PWR13_464 [Archaeoglobi archaeon]|nr:hypothetical protein [Archaeoglobi archaeon]MDK2781436.1 hypothetical protein [Archaeoglobi archaeon]
MKGFSEELFHARMLDALNLNFSERDGEEMSERLTFYDQRRWENWLSRFREMEIEKVSEEELSSFLINMMDDVVVALLKILKSVEKGILQTDEAKRMIEEIKEIILKPVELNDELKNMHIQSIQNSLLAAIASFERYLSGGEERGETEELIREAVEAEQKGDYERALELISEVGARVLRGEKLSDSLFSEIPDGIVLEWMDGIDSISAAMTLDVEVETGDEEEEEI